MTTLRRIPRISADVDTQELALASLTKLVVVEMKNFGLGLHLSIELIDFGGAFSLLAIDVYFTRGGTDPAWCVLRSGAAAIARDWLDNLTKLFIAFLRQSNPFRNVLGSRAPALSVRRDAGSRQFPTSCVEIRPVVHDDMSRCDQVISRSLRDQVAADR